MVSNIPPSGTPPLPPPSGGDRPEKGDNIKEIMRELLALEEKLRSYLGPPLDVKALKKFLPEMKAFLEDHKQALYKAMEEHGYPIGGPFSISAEFDSAISAINNFMEHPNAASADLLNESVTSLNYFLRSAPIFHLDGGT